ncbi:MAG: flavodoxin family protein, partial [Promethearchaeota archaeon]
SPTYYGTMAAEIKKFIDDSVKFHGKLEGKVGAAFSSAAITGHETTVISILEALLIHGMIIQGDSKGQHYGATTVGKPDKNEAKWCQRFGQRVAELVKLIFS